jgi:hypothetical protein
MMLLCSRVVSSADWMLSGKQKTNRWLNLNFALDRTYFYRPMDLIYSNANFAFLVVFVVDLGYN